MNAPYAIKPLFDQDGNHVDIYYPFKLIQDAIRMANSLSRQDYDGVLVYKRNDTGWGDPWQCIGCSEKGVISNF